MKKTLLFLGSLFVLGTANATVTQIVDLSTGTVNAGPTLIPTTQQDPEYNVLFPGGSTFQPTYAAQHSSWQYSGQVPTCGKWISPEPLNGGNINCITCSNVTGPGIYKYRKTFTKNNNCNIISAKLVVNYTMADNTMKQLDINGNSAQTFPLPPHVFSPSIVCCWNPNISFTVNLNPASIVNGTNTFDILVENNNATGGQWTISGVAFCGYLEIVYEDPLKDQTTSITGPTSFCSNATIYQYGNDGAATNATSYEWSLTESDALGNITNPGNTWSSGMIAGSPNLQIFPTMTCNKYYLVKLKVYNACSNAQATRVIYVNCPPSVYAGPDVTICEGDCVYLDATGPYKFHTYQWVYLGDEPFPVGSGDGVTVCPTTTSTYCVTITNTNTGCSSYDCMTVNVDKLNANFNLSANVSNPNYMTLTATPLQLANYPATMQILWTIEEEVSPGNWIFIADNNPWPFGYIYNCWNANIPVAENFSGFDGVNYLYDNTNCLPNPGHFKYNTNYRITRSVWSDYCPMESASYTIQYNYGIAPGDGGGGDPSGIMPVTPPDVRSYASGYHSQPENAEKPDFALYPNPANTFVTIEMKNAVEQPVKIELTDLSGRVVGTFVMNEGTTQTTLDVSTLVNGAYLVRIAESGKTVLTKKVLINR